MPYAPGDIHLLFDTMVETGASDLHITVGRPPVLRLKGGLKNIKGDPLTDEERLVRKEHDSPEERLQRVLCGECNGETTDTSAGHQRR